MKIEIIGNCYNLRQIGKNKWATKEELTYKINRAIYVIPVGFVCDCASIPAPFLPLFGKKPNIMLESAVIHDFLYKNKIESRLYADEVMLGVMNKFNNPKYQWQRDAIYWAVRTFGMTGWGK